jgi:hypothetical protein
MFQARSASDTFDRAISERGSSDRASLDGAKRRLAKSIVSSRLFVEEEIALAMGE